MDHLLLPRGAAVLESERAPYIADVYDGDSFLDFPKRSRFRPLYERVLPPDGYPSSTDTFSDQSMRELEILIQTWLVFGLFHEIFGSLASQDDFITYEPLSKRPLLSTKILPQMVDRWVAANYGGGEQVEKKAQFEHLKTCLRLAYRFLSTLRRRPNIELTVLWSTASIVETLENVVCETLDDPASIRSLGLTWAECYRRDELVDLMIENGWCPAEARRWIKAAESLQVLYYLSKLERIKTKDHSTCVGAVCSAYQYDFENHHAVHRCQKGDCGELEIDIEPIKAALDEGLFGILEATGEEDLSKMTVRVISSKENVPYVALSHVWADGLGNPAANTLPRCQIAYIAAIVKELQRRTKTERLLFWLDTICCPVDSPRHRAQCLAKMKQIYRNAAHVLVLDSQLSHYTADQIDCVEIGIRTIFSAWTCRLWTLQEGALASSLWIQLNDGPVDLDSTEREASRLYKTRFIHNPLLLTLVADLRKIRQLGGNDNILDPTTSRSSDLIDIQIALKHRTVSVPSDEAICLCTLLDLDQLPIVQALPEDRMYTFWSTLAPQGLVIPKNIVFFTGPRSEHPGIRWAPRSFLGKVSFYSFRRPRNQNEVATVTPDGLLAEFPAAELCLRPPLYNRQADCWNNALLDVANLRWMRESEYVWYMLNYPGNEKFPSEELLTQTRHVAQEGRLVAILADGLHDLGNGLHDRDVTFGLLGGIIDDDNQTTTFRSERPVYVGRMKKSLAHVLEAVYQHSSAEQLSSINVQRPKDPSEVPLDKDEMLSRLPNTVVAELLRIAGTAFDKEPELVQTFVELNVSGKTVNNLEFAARVFAVYMTFFVAGRTGDIGHVWPHDQKWCVD